MTALTWFLASLGFLIAQWYALFTGAPEAAIPFGVFSILCAYFAAESNQ